MLSTFLEFENGRWHEDYQAYCCHNIKGKIEVLLCFDTHHIICCVLHSSVTSSLSLMVMMAGNPLFSHSYYKSMIIRIPELRVAMVARAVYREGFLSLVPKTVCNDLGSHCNSCADLSIPVVDC